MTRINKNNKNNNNYLQKMQKIKQNKEALRQKYRNTEFFLVRNTVQKKLHKVI